MSLRAALVPTLIAGLISIFPAAGSAQDSLTLAETLAGRVLFVTSGGYWEELAAPEPDDAAQSQQQADAAVKAADGAEPQAKNENAEAPVAAPTDAAAPRRGYYRLVAIRGEDDRSLVHLQQMELTPQGPEVTMSIGVEEINSLGGYVTDIRPEDSTGTATGPGFAAYIYLKTDPSVAEPDAWTLFVDEFGDIQVEQSTN